MTSINEFNQIRILRSKGNKCFNIIKYCDNMNESLLIRIYSYFDNDNEIL